MQVQGGLARATRNYIDIIDGFVGHLTWFCAAMRPYRATTFQIEISKTLYCISNNKNTYRNRNNQNL
jgi:hypothetical protein